MSNETADSINEREKLIYRLRNDWRYVRQNYREIVKYFGLVDYMSMKLQRVTEHLEDVIRALGSRKATLEEIGASEEELVKITAVVRSHQRWSWLYKRIFSFALRYKVLRHRY